MRKNKPKRGKYKQYPYSFGGRELLLQGYERQGLEYLLSVGFTPKEIRCECEHDFSIRYKYRKKHRNYFPDMYIPKIRLIVEVKSEHTLGLKGRRRRGWSMTCAKAIACHEKGFKFMLLLLNRNGERIKMPKMWAYMKKEECLRQLGMMNIVKEGLFQ